MLNLLSKNTLPNFFSNQFIQCFTTFILGLLLGYKKYSPILIIFSILILYYYSYFIHRLFHNLPYTINLHTMFHHNVKNNNNIIMRIINLLIELFTNIMFFVIFYLFQKLIKFDFVPEIIIFYYGFIYVSVHIVNYSLFHVSSQHVIHHKTFNGTKTYNYGPDLVDHIFNTNYSTNFENYNHIMPNVFLSFLITYYLYKPKLF